MVSTNYKLEASKLEVIAEAIETKQQVLALQNANIQMAQGFFFSHPIPAADFIVYHCKTCEGNAIIWDM
jgi:sensor c-di-GMP phosphodiesterase-like protein